jgi:hypothetical protein
MVLHDMLVCALLQVRYEPLDNTVKVQQQSEAAAATKQRLSIKKEQKRLSVVKSSFRKPSLMPIR